MDLQGYSKDTFKRTMGDLVKYEEYVTEISETKQLRGGKLPARVYTIIIMEPDAISVDDIKKMKQAGQQPPKPKQEMKDDSPPKDTGEEDAEEKKHESN